jgi:hypothetical protein
MFVATTSRADPGGGRGGRTRGGGGESRYKGGGSGSQGGGGDRVYSGSERRYKGGGGSQGGWGDGANRGGGRTYGGGGYVDRGGRAYGGGSRYRGSAPYYGSRGSYYGGPPYHSGYVRYGRPYRYGCGRPHSYVSFGIGLGVPYYCPPAYHYYVAPHPVIEEPSDLIDVENLPPAGCYYYDPFCDRQFADLDTYTDHIDRETHGKTIEIIDRDSGDRLRTLEFVDGYWSVRR